MYTVGYEVLMYRIYIMSNNKLIVLNGTVIITDQSYP